MNFRVPQQRSELFRNIVQFYLNRSSDKRFKAFGFIPETCASANIHRVLRKAMLKTRPQAKQEPGNQRRSKNGTHDIDRQLGTLPAISAQHVNQQHEKHAKD